MQYQACESQRLKVVDSRDSTRSIRRRRSCLDCGHRFTTYERLELYMCARCGCDDGRIEAFDLNSGGAWRRRRCANCGFVYETQERLSAMEVRVLKSHGRTEPFNRGKLYRSVMVAGAKRPIESDWAEDAVNDIENTILTGDRLEVSSKRIADMVMERLLAVDEVAYVRYASSYFEAGGIQEMLDVINDTDRRRERTEIERTNLPLVAEELDLS